MPITASVTERWKVTAVQGPHKLPTEVSEVKALCGHDHVAATSYVKRNLPGYSMSSVHYRTLGRTEFWVVDEKTQHSAKLFCERLL